MELASFFYEVIVHDIGWSGISDSCGWAGRSVVEVAEEVEQCHLNQVELLGSLHTIIHGYCGHVPFLHCKFEGKSGLHRFVALE